MHKSACFFCHVFKGRQFLLFLTGQWNLPKRDVLLRKENLLTDEHFLSCRSWLPFTCVRKTKLKMVALLPFKVCPFTKSLINIGHPDKKGAKRDNLGLIFHILQKVCCDSLELISMGFFFNIETY